MVSVGWYTEDVNTVSLRSHVQLVNLERAEKGVPLRPRVRQRRVKKRHRLHPGLAFSGNRCRGFGYVPPKGFIKDGGQEPVPTLPGAMEMVLGALGVFCLEDGGSQR